MSTKVKEHNLKLEVESKAPFDVRDVTAQENLNQPWMVKLFVRSPKHDLDLSKIVTRPAAVRVTMVEGLHRVWTGVVSSIEHVNWDTASTALSTYRVTVVDNIALLQFRRGHRIFQHKKIPHIVDAILKEWKIEAEWRVDIGAYKEKEYCLQYGESDYDFVHRLLEEAGITYYFINKGAGGGMIQSQIVFNDKPQATARSVTLPWVDNPNEVGGTGFFTSVRLAHTHKPGLVTLGDYNFRKPKKPLFASSDKATGIEGSREIYEYAPGNFLIETGGPGQGPGDEKVADDKSTTTHDWEDFGKKKAQLFLESVRRDKRIIQYHTSNQALRAGGVFAIDPHPHSELDGKDMLCISSICMVNAVGEWTVQGAAVFADQPYRPARITKKPTISGVQAAIVTGPKGEEIYVDELGRVRVRFLWDREGEFDDKATCWLRVSQMWGGSQYGVVNLPRIGHEVIVDFLDGDPDQPVIVGRLHTVPAPQPYILPKHKTRSTWQTNTTPNQASGKDFNERMFEDKKGEELVFVQAQRNFMSLTKRHETERTGEDRLAVIGKHHLAVVREIDSRHASAQHIVRMVEPRDLKILEMEDPQFSNKDTFINLEKGMAGDKIVLTTGSAKIELAGNDIKISADRGIRFSADKDLIIKGSNHFLNFLPAFVMPSRASTDIDDKIKKPEDDVKNKIEQLFSKDKKPETKAQTKIKKIKGALDAMDPVYRQQQADILACKDVTGHPKNKSLDDADTKGKPVAVIMAGPPASGKSTLRNNSEALKKIPSVDTDDIKKEIHEGKVPAMGSDGKPLAGRWKLKPANPEEEKINFEIHKASGAEAEKRWKDSLAKGEPVLFDTVGAWKPHVEGLVKEASAAGYHVHLALAYTDRATAIDSNQRRERTVPEDALTERHKMLTENWPSYKDIPGVASVEKRVR
jgi:type VI secretion system secreted protein VgrG